MAYTTVGTVEFTIIFVLFGVDPIDRRNELTKNRYKQCVYASAGAGVIIRARNVEST